MQIRTYNFTTSSGYDFSLMFSGVSNMISESDFVMENLETPISFDNSDLIKENFEFHSPYEFSKAIRDSEIHAVATANNNWYNGLI